MSKTYIPGRRYIPILLLEELTGKDADPSALLQLELTKLREEVISMLPLATCSLSLIWRWQVFNDSDDRPPSITDIMRGVPTIEEIQKAVNGKPQLDTVEIMLDVITEELK